MGMEAKLKDLHSFYLRYICDILMIWTGSKEQFENFIQEINNCHPRIKLHYEIHHKEIKVFEKTVFLDSDGKLKPKLYRKQTDC